MPTNPPTITMTSFAKFVVADAAGQLARVREIKRQYEKPYASGQDFWKALRDSIEQLHRRGATRSQADAIWSGTLPNRAAQYESAGKGYAKFWGNKTIEPLASPKPYIWQHDRLSVRVHPELLVRVNDTPTLIKLHTDQKLPLDQRLANPLLYLIESLFPGDHQVLLLDLHRGKAWSRRTERGDYETVLRMQAASFLLGWDLIDEEGQAAAS